MDIVQRKILSVEILDWFDGIVLGIVQLSWRGGFFLASLVAWSPDDKRRALALVPVTQEQQDRFRAMAASDWSQLLIDLRLFCSAATGRAIILCVDDRTDVIAGETEVNCADVSGDMIGDVSESTEAQRQRWLGCFPDSQ
jgi:hypothetical protein